jgi:hypothetical protein
MREGEVGRKSLGQWDFKAGIEDPIAQVAMYKHPGPRWPAQTVLIRDVNKFSEIAVIC